MAEIVTKQVDTMHETDINIDKHFISTSHSNGDNKVKMFIKHIMGIWLGTQFTQRYSHVADRK